MKKWQLKQRQSLPLDCKINMSMNKIREWYSHFNGNVYVAFSGGKDSTVLLDLVRKELGDQIPAVFADTGLEFPEIRDFVKTIPNVIWLKPKMPFTEVIKSYGFPVISKEQSQFIHEYRTTKSEKLKSIRRNGNKWGRGKISKRWGYLIDADFKISDRCCNIMKKRPFKKYEKETGRYPLIGTMSYESALRTQKYLKTGCNAFEAVRPTSTPISFWTEDDVWNYIKETNLPYSKIYDMGYERTGCMFCMFGIHMEKGENRFQRMAKTHPKQYDYCINKLGCGRVLDFIGIKY